MFLNSAAPNYDEISPACFKLVFVLIHRCNQMLNSINTFDTMRKISFCFASLNESNTDVAFVSLQVPKEVRKV